MRILADFTIPPGWLEMKSDPATEQGSPTSASSPSPTGQSDAAVEVEAMARLLTSIGSLYCGIRLCEDGELGSCASLTLAVQPFDYGDGRVAVEGVVEALLAARGGQWTGKVMPLPCGDAAVLTGPQRLSLGTREEADEEQRITLAQLQAFVPVPGRMGPAGEQVMLVATLSALSADHWQECCADMVSVLRSVRFTLEPDQTVGS